MEVRESCRAQRRLGFFSSFFVVAALVSISAIDASVHDYFNEAFTSRSNAFFFHGGNEGLHAPRSVIPPSSSMTFPNITTGPKGKSFISLYVYPRKNAIEVLWMKCLESAAGSPSIGEVSSPLASN
ncbi:uncharacterized protein LOC108957590 [Eucalyptus grandis]|uniref:uncharacterized protein LOC108957590 n=1 Tax=Eucalyptus grandis TaxID=71139 RepID=UPI00192EA7F5|nr:uncharacterized protein LOC108957590 [Eucalyptus grandis]